MRYVRGFMELTRYNKIRNKQTNSHSVLLKNNSKDGLAETNEENVVFEGAPGNNNRERKGVVSHSLKERGCI